MAELTLIQKIALVASVILPLWNIPLITRIVQRRSSRDISMAWALGVWTCLLLMLPAGIKSEDVVWRTFVAVNFTLFSLVVLTVLRYRTHARS